MTALILAMLTLPNWIRPEYQSRLIVAPEYFTICYEHPAGKVWCWSGTPEQWEKIYVEQVNPRSGP